MNLIELDRALRQLRMSGMAVTLETRMLQAQADAMAHINTLATLSGGGSAVEEWQALAVSGRSRWNNEHWCRMPVKWYWIS